MIRGDKAVACLADALHDLYPIEPSHRSWQDRIREEWPEMDWVHSGFYSSHAVSDAELLARDMLIYGHAYTSDGARVDPLMVTLDVGGAEARAVSVSGAYYSPGSFRKRRWWTRPFRSLAGMTYLKPFIQLAEKSVLTFLQVLLTAYLASGSLGFEGSDQWIISAIAAAGTVVANGMPELAGLPFGLDMVYRVARTYAVGFLTLFFAPGMMDLSVSSASAAAWAALPAALVIVKGVIAKHLGDATPALLPASIDIAPTWTLPPHGA